MPLGIYHNPEVWFGTQEILQLGNFSFHEPVATKQFDNIIVSAFRDGLFTFDFSRWPAHRDNPAKRSASQVEIINTYLLCLYCAVATRGMWINDSRQQIPIMRVNHSNIFSVHPRGYATTQLSNDMMRMVMQRQELTKSPHIILAWQLPERALEISLHLFSDLWQSADDRVFTIADLLLGAHVAHFNLRFAEALGLAWLICETLLDDVWRQYIGRNRKRNGKPFITSNEKNDRVKRLTSRDYSASVQIEILSLLDEISYEHYCSLTYARQARNDWIHGLKLASREEEESANAIQLAERLFQNKYSFDTALPPHAGRVFVTGGDYVDEDKSSNNLLLREYEYNKALVHVPGLDQELRRALGEHTTGISYHGQTVRVHLLADSPPEDDLLAKEIIDAHDPAFLTIDEAHRSLAGEHRFDTPRYRPHVVGDGKDEATVTVRLPHTKKSQVVISLDKQDHLVNLNNGVGELKITRNDLPGTMIELSVKNHPCDPLEIEVIAP